MKTLYRFKNGNVLKLTVKSVNLVTPFSYQFYKEPLLFSLSNDNSKKLTVFTIQVNNDILTNPFNIDLNQKL